MESPLRFESPGGEDIVKGVGFTQPVGIVVLGCHYYAGIFISISNYVGQELTHETLKFFTCFLRDNPSMDGAALQIAMFIKVVKLCRAKS